MFALIRLITPPILSDARLDDAKIGLRRWPAERQSEGGAPPFSQQEAVGQID